jgi:hypothetical protein
VGCRFAAIGRMKNLRRVSCRFICPIQTLSLSLEGAFLVFVCRFNRSKISVLQILCKYSAPYFSTISKCSLYSMNGSRFKIATLNAPFRM